MMQEQCTGLAKGTSSALVLFSSGLDSTYNLLRAKKHFKKIAALFFDYGQKSASQEYVHVKRACEKLDVEFLKIDLLWYKNLSSTLLSAGVRPTTFNSLNEINEKDRPAEWVPNRNGVFVNIAAAIAESKGYQNIVIGVNLEEAGRYPDNTVDFVDIANKLFEYSTLSKPRLVSFSSEMIKKDILIELLGLMEESGLGKEYVWSCYDSYERMCGRCESCLRLKNALKAHGRDGEWKELFLR